LHIHGGRRDFGSERENIWTHVGNGLEWPILGHETASDGGGKV